MQNQPTDRSVIFVVPEAVKVVDRGLASADAYEVHILKPGEYEAKWDNGSWYLSVPTTLIESYWVNKLFAATSARRDLSHKDSTLYVSIYDYLVRDLGEGDTALVRAGEDAEWEIVDGRRVCKDPAIVARKVALAAA